MADVKTRHVHGSRGAGSKSLASGWNAFITLHANPLRAVTLRAVVPFVCTLLGACFSPEPYTEHLCRTCTSECPEGLTCYGQRCVRVCDASCVGDHECRDGACVPSGGEQCPVRTVRLALCVGRPSDVVAATQLGVSSEDPWVVLDSRLPEGVSFNPATGRLSGTPRRAERGTITVRHGVPGTEELSVEVAPLLCPRIEATRVSWCLGEDESTELLPSLPGQYTWRLQSAPAGVELNGDVLSGNLDQEATHSVWVQLVESGSVVDEATFELAVSDCKGSAPTELVAPALEIITLAALPNACEGIQYAAAFEASGGVPGYRWTLESAPPGLALDAASGRLTGVPLASGDFELRVSVLDTAGSQDSLRATVHVTSATEECVTSPLGPVEEEACAVGDAATCPRPPLQIATADLGAVCAGEPLSARLEASGGGGGYRWSLLNPAPSGLELERTGELHGIPAAEAGRKHRLSVSVTSTFIDTPVYGTVPLEIVTCDGLVFLTDDADAGRLFLASTDSGAVDELSAGVLGAGEGVHSFALSTDAAHLAFDVARENAARRLYSVDFATLEARLPTFAPALPEGASLIDYRWSLDGSQLAATFRAGDDVFLGVSPAAGGPGSSIHVTGRYRSSLFWAGERICYVAPGLLPEFAGVLCHAITPDGIDDRAPLTGTFDSTSLRTDLLLSSDEGYLAILPDSLAPAAQYILPGDIASSSQHNGGVFSPGLHRAAGPAADDRTVFEVLTSRGMPREPIVLARLDPCDKIDAWSFDENSIACREADSLAIHQLGMEGALDASGVVQDSAGYPEEEFRRLWAPGGQWYAYDERGTLKVVSLAAAPLRSRSIFEGGAQSPYVGLGTDDSGTRLYYHHGRDLEAFDVRTNFLVQNLNGAVSLPDPAPCNEAQLDDGPRLWCGARSTPSFFFPAPAAARVAFVDRQNQLYVADVADVADVDDVAAGDETSTDAARAPRLVHPSSVKCTMDSGEPACDNFVQWVPRRAPR